MSEERFIDLESRLAHQDQMLHELDEALTAQQARLLRLEALCQALTDRVRALDEVGPDGDPAEERPPHY